MKDFFQNLINSCYKRIFHQEIGIGMKDFFKNLSYVAIGTVIATILSFIFNILAGRMLGPTEYGKFTLIRSVAMFLYIPMLLGFNTAMVKYGSEKEDFERRAKIISTTHVLIFLFTLASVILYFIFQPQLSSIFSISSDLFYLTIIFAVLFSFYTITTNSLRCLFKMKTFAIFRVVYSVVLLFAFLFFVFIKDLLSFKSMIYSIFLAYGIVGLILFTFFLRKYFRFSFDKGWAKTLTKYSLFAVIGGLSYAFYTSADKILINRFMTIGDVGIYKAYWLGSINIAGLFSGIFSTVFFPAASKYKNKKILFERINRLVPYIFAVGLPFIFISEFAVLKFYGEGYSINLLLILLLSITSILIVWYGLYDWIFCSQGIKGIKLVTLATTIIAILDVFLNICLIPYFGLHGAILSILASFTVGIICLVLFKKRIVYE